MKEKKKEVDIIYHIKIPKKVWEDKRILWPEKILLYIITSTDRENNGCNSTNLQLSILLNVGESRISQMVSKLKKLKYIEQTFFDGRTRILKSLIK